MYLHQAFSSRHNNVHNPANGYNSSKQRTAVTAAAAAAAAVANKRSRQRR